MCGFASLVASCWPVVFQFSERLWSLLARLVRTEGKLKIFEVQVNNPMFKVIRLIRATEQTKQKTTTPNLHVNSTKVKAGTIIDEH